MTDFAAARFFMVEGQIRPNKVTDHRLVDALSETPREAFVPESALTAAAAAALSAQGVTNATVVTGPLAVGHAEGGPYDVIVIEGTIPEVPAALADQLSEDGRLVAIVQDARGVGEVRLFQRVGGVLSSRVLFEAQPHALPGFEKKAAFVF
jgi:protein-L-isoaspartate(D-aspartate) O-methyltransferase